MKKLKKVIVVEEDGKTKEFNKGAFVTVKYGKNEDAAKIMYYFCENNSKTDSENLKAIFLIN